MRRTSALAAAALTAALALSSCAGSDDGSDADADAGSGTASSPSPSTSETTSPSEESPSDEPGDESPSTDALVLAVQPSGAARCMAPTPESLARFTHAFMGTVTAVDDEGDEGVVLTVDHWFAGGGPATVRIDTETGTDKGVRTTDVGIFAMKEGKQYLVSGTDGYVALCGLSDRWSPKLEQLYMAAFPQ